MTCKNNLSSLRMNSWGFLHHIICSHEQSYWLQQGQLWDQRDANSGPIFVCLFKHRSFLEEEEKGSVFLQNLWHCVCARDEGRALAAACSSQPSQGCSHLSPGAAVQGSAPSAPISTAQRPMGLGRWEWALLLRKRGEESGGKQKAFGQVPTAATWDA